MDNIKTFMNIGFVILCLAMLWYLFTYEPGGTKAQSQAPKRQVNPYSQEDLNPYANQEDDYYQQDTRYEEPAYDTYPNSYPDPEPTEAYRTKPVPKSNDYTYDDKYDYEYSNDSPFEETDFTPPPPRNNNNYQRSNPPRNTQTTPAPQPTRSTSNAIRFISKRFSRDGQLGTYRGPMKNNRPHGFAIFEYDNGDLYIGEYRNGERNGFGNSIFKKRGKIQLRKYINGKKVQNRNISGVSYGTMRFVHGGLKGTFYGPLRKGEPHGYGYFQYDNGNMFIGTYQNGKRNGLGSVIYADGSVKFQEYKNGIEAGAYSNF